MVRDNSWVKSKDTRNGLNVFVSKFMVEDQEWIRVEYETQDGTRVGVQQQYNIDGIRFLNVLIDEVNTNN